MAQLAPASKFYFEWIRRTFVGKLARAELGAGVLTLVTIPVGSDWFERTFGASSWLPLYIFGTVFVLLVVIGFLKAPRDLYVEALAEIVTLRLTIEDKERIQNALNELWRLRKEGVELRNKRIVREEFDAWTAEFDKWREKVYEQAGRISANLEQWLRILDQLTQPPVSKAIHPQHARKLMLFSEILHRMQLFLERDLRWPKLGA